LNQSRKAAGGAGQLFGCELNAEYERLPSAGSAGREARYEGSGTRQRRGGG
jgi:hypothetical protein